MARAFSQAALHRGVIAVVVFLLAPVDLTQLSCFAPVHVDEAFTLNRGFPTGPLYRSLADGRRLTKLVYYLRESSHGARNLRRPWRATA